MLDEMIAQTHWANQKTIDWLSATPAASSGAHRLASHVLNAERIWIQRVMGLEQDPDRFKPLALSTMSDINQANHDDLARLVLGDCLTEFDYRLFDGTPYRSSLKTVVLHLFSHGFHHRAQIATMAIQAGLEFPGVSYIDYARAR